MKAGARIFWISLCLAVPCSAQQASDAAWESFSSFLTHQFPAINNQYIVQYPSTPVMAVWLNRNSFYSEQALEDVAGTIPPAGALWTPTGNLISDRYGLIVDALDFPTAPSVTQERKLSVVSAYRASVTGLENAIKVLKTQIQTEMVKNPAKTEIELGEQLKAVREKNKDVLQKSYDEYDAEVSRMDQITDPNWLVRSSVLEYRKARLRAAKDVIDPGMFEFDGSSASLRSIVEGGKAASSGGTCSTTWKFGASDSSKQSGKGYVSVSARAGSFVILKERKVQSEDLLKEKDDFISISYCSQGYIPLRAGSWFSSSLLNLVHDGVVALYKTSSLNSSTIFKDDGVLPRIPVAVIVAFRPRIEARISRSYAQLLISEWNSGGDIVMGPFHFSEKGSGVSVRDSVVMNSDGSITLDTLGDVPYIVAVVSRKLL